jgi:DNA-binding transcriptional ArsR family regulator
VLETELLDFIQSSFKSIWSLEVLIFLKQAPEESWSVDELVRELRGSVPIVTQSLGMLEVAGLLATDIDGKVRYAPAAADISRLADASERAYRDRPGEVRRVILTAPNDKLHTFADAFRFKKDQG